MHPELTGQRRGEKVCQPTTMIQLSSPIWSPFSRDCSRPRSASRHGSIPQNSRERPTGPAC
jgi:hypothetical protein